MEEHCIHIFIYYLTLFLQTVSEGRIKFITIILKISTLRQRGKVAYFQVPSKSKENESPEHSPLVRQDHAGSQRQQRGFPAQSRFVGRSTKNWNSLLTSEERAFGSI